MAPALVVSIKRPSSDGVTTCVAVRSPSEEINIMSDRIAGNAGLDIDTSEQLSLITDTEKELKALGWVDCSIRLEALGKDYNVRFAIVPDHFMSEDLRLGAPFLIGAQLEKRR